MSEVYIDRYTARGKCQFCGKSGPEYVFKEMSKSQRKFLKSQYGWIFRKVSNFRGDDEFLGKICVDCRKAGKLKELLKKV